MIALLVLASLTFTVPRYSARDCHELPLIPAGVKHFRAWAAVIRPGETTRFVQFVGLNLPRSGSRDGARVVWPLPPSIGVGDSFAVRVAVGDSAKNWAGAGCGGDAEVRGRRKP